MTPIEILKKYFNEQGMCSIPKSVKEAINELETLQDKLKKMSKLCD